MNRSQIRTLVRDLLNEETPGFWTDAQLNSFIDLGNMKVNAIISTLREDFFTKAVTFSTTAGQDKYSLPADCRFVRRVEIYDAGNPGYIIKLDTIRWPRVEANGDWLFTSSGQPKRYVIIGSTLKFFPVPDAVYTMRMYYDWRQDALDSDDDVPQAPPEYHDMLVYWACLLAKAKNEEEDNKFVAFFDSRKAELIQHMIHRGGEDIVAVEAYLEGII